CRLAADRTLATEEHSIVSDERRERFVIALRHRCREAVFGIAYLLSELLQRFGARSVDERQRQQTGKRRQDESRSRESHWVLRFYLAAQRPGATSMAIVRPFCSWPSRSRRAPRAACRPQCRETPSKCRARSPEDRAGKRRAVALSTRRRAF